MERPSLPDAAAARAELQRFIALHPQHPSAPAIGVLLRQSAPFSEAEIAAAIENAKPSVSSTFGAMGDIVRAILRAHFGGTQS